MATSLRFGIPACVTALTKAPVVKRCYRIMLQPNAVMHNIHHEVKVI